MGVLIDFTSQRAIKRSLRPRSGDSARRGEILFFTGVRYVRNLASDMAPHEPPGHNEGASPGGRRRRKRA